MYIYKNFLEFIFTFNYMFVQVMQDPMEATDVGSLWAGVIGILDPPIASAGNWVWVFCKSSMHS